MLKNDFHNKLIEATNTVKDLFEEQFNVAQEAINNLPEGQEDKKQKLTILLKSLRSKKMHSPSAVEDVINELKKIIDGSKC